MRWHVHGTDSATGKNVELALDEDDPSRAIRAAIDRQITVSHITPGEPPSKAKRWALPVTFALFIAATLGIIALYAQNRILRGNLNQALDEQTRMASSVAQAEHVAADIRASGTLAKDAASQVNKLANDLAAARNRMSMTEVQLSAAQREKEDLEKSAQRVPGLEKDLLTIHEQLRTATAKLAASDKLATQLKGELALQSRRMDQLENATPSRTATAPTDSSAPRIAELEKANQLLAAEIDKLKNELLLAAAQSTIIQREPAPIPVIAAAATPSWALRVSYETARGFLALHSDHDTQSMSPEPGTALLASFGMQPSNAVQLRFVHDRAKERVYSITLALSLAADGPKDKLAENRQLISDFLSTFVPDLKDPISIISAATTQLANEGDSRRLLLLNNDSKLTIWNDKTGIFTLKIEPLRN